MHNSSQHYIVGGNRSLAGRNPWPPIRERCAGRHFQSRPQRKTSMYRMSWMSLFNNKGGKVQHNLDFVYCYGTQQALQEPMIKQLPDQHTNCTSRIINAPLEQPNSNSHPNRLSLSVFTKAGEGWVMGV